MGNKDWTSGDSRVLKISKTNVTAKNVGSTTMKRGDQIVNVNILTAAFDKKSVTVAAGDDQQLTISGFQPEEGTIQLNEAGDTLPVVFTSSNPDVAQVYTDGSVYAMSKGKTVITAWINGVALKCTVKVVDFQKPSFDFTQTTEALRLKPNQTVVVKASGFAAKNATWSSDQTPKPESDLGKGVLYEDGVIRIGKGGKITAIGVGESLVSATSGGTTLNFRVEVLPPAAKSLHLIKGTSKAVKLYGEKGKIEWAPADGEPTDIVSVDKGKIKGEKCGEVQLRVTRGGFVYILNVFVEDPTITTPGISGNPYKYSCEMKVGEKLDIAYNSIYQYVVLKSNKSNIAYVDPEGQIEARGVGTAKLTAKVDGKTITITVKVTK